MNNSLGKLSGDVTLISLFMCEVCICYEDIEPKLATFCFYKDNFKIDSKQMKKSLLEKF